MPFFLALIGAFVGAVFGAMGSEASALVLGAGIGWLLGQIVTLKTRLGALERARESAAIASRTAAAHLNSATVAQESNRVTPPVPPPPPATVEPHRAPEIDRFSAPAASPDAQFASAPAAQAAPAGSADAQFVAAPAASAVPTSAPSISAPEPAPRPTPNAASAPTAAMPESPDFGLRTGNALRRWFTEGNLPAKLGMLVLFVGVAALLRYAVAEGMLYVPIEWRLAGVSAAAIAGLIFGFRQRIKRRAFGLALQGGAIGVLLLTVFAAYRLYHLLEPGAAFALVVALVAASALLAVLQDAVALAVLGFIGGYLAPVLIATGSREPAALFGWYAVLNAAVFGVAWVRSWRALNLIGFAFTFVIGTWWGARYYQPRYLATVEPFLILFFLFYVGIAVLYAWRQPGRGSRAVDGTLVFGTPLLAFTLQAALVDDQWLLAYSALAMALLYGGLFAWLRHRAGLRTLSESFAALGVGFATVAIPLALSGQATVITWALEGVALVWLGLRQRRGLPQLAGVVLQLLAGVAFCVELAEYFVATTADEPALINARFVAGMLLALAGVATAWLYDRRAGDYPAAIAALALAWGTWWWGFTGLQEIHAQIEPQQISNWITAFAVFSLLATALLRRTLKWQRIGYVAILIYPVMLPLVWLAHVANDSVLELWGFLPWIGYLAVGRVGLWLMREPPQPGLGFAHLTYLAVLPLVLGLQLWNLGPDLHVGEGWRSALPILPLLLLTFALEAAPGRMAAPLADRFKRYSYHYFLLAAAVLVAWLVATAESAGDAAPFRFIPVLNPLESMQLAVVLLLAWCARRGAFGAPVAYGRVLGVAGVALFAWLSVSTLRAVHHLTGRAWTPDLIDDMTAQVALTVVWSVVGVSALIIGSQRRSRPLWLCGAVLMGIVLAKLVLIDRGYTGNVEGIVSFIAVGLLLTIVGYFAPSPPRAVAPVA